MELTAENVEETLKYFLFNEDELPKIDRTGAIEWVKNNGVVVDGIMRTFAFNSERVKEKTEDVRSMLEQVPDEFKIGMSFLNLCYTKDKVHWGEHRNMDELVVIATACGFGGYIGTRELWFKMPGGMPYVQFKL